jgi:two-component system, OmpR family, KDP operon response regulator KdpE
MTGESRPAGPVILIVEDDGQMRRFLRTTLAAHGFRLLEAGTAADGARLAAEHVPDLVLLDLGLPDMDGLEVARQIRTWSGTPIIVLSARDQERQKVEALDAGADDYLTKPFGLGELLARIRVALRHARQRAAGSLDEPFESGPLRVDLAARRVLLDGREVHLTPVEYKLLATLVRHAGRVVTHNQLLQAVWGPQSAGETQYLRVYMTHLRRKLEPDPAKPRLFGTEAGVGYRLLVEE